MSGASSRGEKRRPGTGPHSVTMTRTRSLAPPLLDLLEAIRDAVIVVDREWRYVYVNPRAEELSRRSRGELIGRSMWDVFPETVGTLPYHQLRRAMQERVPVEYEWFHAPSGAWFRDRVSPGEEGLLLVIQDITAARAADDALWEWDLATGSLVWSAGLRAVSGYDAREAGPSLDWWRDRVHPEEREKVVAGLYSAIERGEDFWTDEYRFRTADGGYTRVVDRGYVVRDEKRRPIRMVGAMFDDAERRQADRELRESEARLRRQSAALAAVAGNPALTSGELEGALREITETAAEVLQVERVSVWLWEPAYEGLWCADLHIRSMGAHQAGAELSAESVPEYFDAVREERIIAAEDAWRDPRTAGLGESYLAPHGIGAMLDAPIHSGGRVVGVLCHEHVGGPRGWTVDEQNFARSLGDLVALAVETAQRRRAEAALRESEARLSAIFSTAGIGMALVDLQGRVLDANPAYQRFLGLGLADLCGSHFLDPTHPEDAAIDRARFKELREGRCDHYQLEKRYRTADGREVFGDVIATLVRDAEGRPLYCIRTVDDITERKQFEDALRYSEEQVRQMQKMEAIGRLAGGVAHDFNNMLAVINGYADLLLQLAGPQSPLRSGLTEIKAAGERSAQLTRQLLAFSRRQVLEPRVLEPQSVVAGLSTLLRRLLGEDVELILDLGPEGLHVRADPGQLEQVLLNLAVNARDAMPQGGALTVRIAPAEVSPDEALKLDLSAGPYIRISVADTGEGVDESIRERIFEPFFTTKPAGQGTGLGLSTVYGIIRQSDGHIDVESRFGEGTTFHILLPRVPEDRPEPPVGGDAPDPGTGSGTVLLVEDEPMVRSLVREVLRRRGYTVLEAADAGEALGLCRTARTPLDLLLTDVVLPGRSGLELAQEVRALRPEMRVLFMSGYSEEVAMQRGIQVAGSAYVQKPFTPEGLALKVAEALSASTPAAGLARRPS